MKRFSFFTFAGGWALVAASSGVLAGCGGNQGESRQPTTMTTQKGRPPANTVDTQRDAEDDDNPATTTSSEEGAPSSSSTSRPRPPPVTTARTTPAREPSSSPPRTPGTPRAPRMTVDP